MATVDVKGLISKWIKKHSAHYYSRQVIKAKFVGEHGPRQQVCDLQCKCGAISVGRSDEVADFVVDADTESSADVITVKQPSHADQHEV